MSSNGFGWKQIWDRTIVPQKKSILELAVELGTTVPGTSIQSTVADRDLAHSLKQVLGRSEPIAARRESFTKRLEKFEEPAVCTFASSLPRTLDAAMVEGFSEYAPTPEFADRMKQVAPASLDAHLYSATHCVLHG